MPSRQTVLSWTRDAPVGPELDAVLGERGAEEVAAERLEASAIGGGDPDVGVEIEAVELGLAGPAGADGVQLRRGAPAPDASAGAGAKGDAALGGGADEAGQHGRGRAEGIARRAGTVRLELAAGEPPSHARVVPVWPSGMPCDRAVRA